MKLLRAHASRPVLLPLLAGLLLLLSLTVGALAPTHADEQQPPAAEPAKEQPGDPAPEKEAESAPKQDDAPAPEAAPKPTEPAPEQEKPAPKPDETKPAPESKEEQPAPKPDASPDAKPEDKKDVAPEKPTPAPKDEEKPSPPPKEDGEPECEDCTETPILPPPHDIAELKRIESKVRDLAKDLTKKVVGIRIGAAQGSGVLVSEDGLILTAGHVSGDPGRDATVIFADGKTGKAKTLGRCDWADAGMMKIVEKGRWPHAPLGDSDAVQRGQWALAMGHPLGYTADRPPVVRIGRVLLPQSEMIQSDCPIVAGDSGGPLFDLEGRVIGINSRISSNVDQNFHVSANVFREYWDTMKEGDVCGNSAPGRDSHDVRKAFHPATQEAARCVVKVRREGKDVAFGTIVGPDGWILTKASRIDGVEGIECALRDKATWSAVLVGVDETYDLAMLKVDGKDLPTINWAEGGATDVGQWVCTIGADHDYPFALGIVSVPRIEIPQTPGTLGVVVEDGENGARVKQVVADSAAQKAGLKSGDVITHVDGVATRDRDRTVAAIKEHRPGEKITIKFRRGEDVLEKEVTLGVLHSPATEKREFQNKSNIGLSDRRDGFPVVLQHDAAVRPEHCGGPIVDLDGRAVGVNIARGGRVETYAIPTDVLIPRLYELMSGRLAPSAAGENEIVENTPPPAVESKPAPPVAKPTEPEKKPTPPEAEPKEPEKKPEPKEEEQKAEPKSEEKTPDVTPEPAPEESKPETQPEPPAEEEKPEPRDETPAEPQEDGESK